MHADFSERSAYPHPDDFKVMRPEYEEKEEGVEDDLEHATITIAPFKVNGTSVTRAGARRAALYEAEKVYRSYHPSYRIQDPYPDEFIDRAGTRWKRLSPMKKDLGDFEFFDEDGSDYADIEQMLLWDVRIGDAFAAVGGGPIACSARTRLECL